MQTQITQRQLLHEPATKMYTSRRQYSIVQVRIVAIMSFAKQCDVKMDVQATVDVVTASTSTSKVNVKM